MTAAMRAGSRRPPAPRQPCTLYDATRRQSEPRLRDSAAQSARVLPGLGMRQAARHLAEPAVDRQDARGEQADHAADHPPVEVAAGEGGLDLVAEDGRGERAGEE